MLTQSHNSFIQQRMAMMLVMLGVLLLPGTLEAQTSMIMEDFESPDVQARIHTLDSRFELVDHAGSRAIKVESGVEKPYPNIRVSAPSTFWDITAYTRVEADVTNLGTTSLRLGMRVDNKGATGRKNSNTGGSTLAPGETATIGVDIDRIFATELRNSLKGMQATPWGIRGEWGGVIDPAKVEQINFFVSSPAEAYHFIIDNIRTTGVFNPETQRIPEPFFPFIDRFGQYVHSQWPGKVTDESQLREAAQREAQEVNQSPRPDSWTQYGGWKDGPKLPATGHFYPIKHEGRWHLVDPEGRLFFSMGMDVVKAESSTVIDQGRESWFKDAPWKSGNPAMQEFVGTATPRRGEYKDVKVQTFDFYAANLLRKYGPDYRNQWLKNTPKRLMNWGFNTIGCWSDPAIIKQPGIPYTHWIFINSAKLPWQPGTRNRIPTPYLLRDSP